MSVGNVMLNIGCLALVGVMATGASGKLHPADNVDTTAVDSILSYPGITWNREDLHPSIRNRVHLTSKQTPSFPLEDPKWMDPRQWPAVMSFMGQPCSLQIRTADSDAIWSVRSVDEVKPRGHYWMWYGGDPRNWKTIQLGPSYRWTAQGALCERSWRGGDSLCFEQYSYLHYPSGELYRFEYVRHGNDPLNPKDPFETLEELFARDGTLIGCRYGRKPQNVTAAYWLGQPVQDREFHDHTRQAFSRVFRPAEPTLR
jgi:hypothetical protein